MSAPRFRSKSSSGCVKKNNCNVTKDVYRMTAGERIKRNMSIEYCEGVCENISMLKKIKSNFDIIYDNSMESLDGSDPTQANIIIQINELRNRIELEIKEKNMEKAMDVLGEIIRLANES